MLNRGRCLEVHSRKKCLRQWNKSSFTTMLLLKYDREAQVFSSGPEVAPATMEEVVFQASQCRSSPGMQTGILNGAQQSLNARHKDVEQCCFLFSFLKET